MGEWDNLSRGVAKSLAVAQNPDGRLEIFGISTDKKAYLVTQNEPNGKWGNWQNFTKI